MHIMHGEAKSILSWLIEQEKVVRLWIDEFTAAGEGEINFVEKLEVHRAWLVDRIEELKRRTV